MKKLPQLRLKAFCGGIRVIEDRKISSEKRPGAQFRAILELI